MFKQSTQEPAAFIRHSNTVNKFSNPKALRMKGNITDNTIKGIIEMTKNLVFLIFSVVYTNPNKPLIPQTVLADFSMSGIKQA